MPEIVLFPDAAALVLAYLDDELTARNVTARFGTVLPTPTTGTFVKVTRTGGISIERVIDQAQLTVEVYAADTATAHDVAQLCRGLLHALRGTTLDGIAVYGINDFAGPQDFPDTISNQARYSQTIQVGLRGQAS